MRIFADLHIHSHYSRATSSKMNIEELSGYAKTKGIGVLGTGDFSHPKWIRELKSKLSEKADGVYSYNGMDFILSSEISLIYTQSGKTRKIHLCMLSPSFEVADQINEWLATRGRVDYDGRPIFGMTCPEFVEKIMEISGKNFVFPAHCMTPWFGILGSKSGFDSVSECFQEQAKHIHAVETGLSADPEMLWRISSLDKYALISNSDSHSPWSWRMGRECNVFELREVSYGSIISAIKDKDPKRFACTIEVDPCYGKYHLDGHRSCGICTEPEKTRKLHGICPVCARPLTIGVLNRVEELSDRPSGYEPEKRIPFKRLLPLAELIAGVYGVSVGSKKAMLAESQLVERFGNELCVLLEAPEDELNAASPEMAGTIMLNRNGKIRIKPGYDGVYGEPLIGDAGKVGKNTVSKTRAVQKGSQKRLFDF